MKIAYQGEPGAYSEAASIEHFGPEAIPVPCESFNQVFENVVEGICDYGLIPIENSLAGSIHRNYDLLIQNPLTIICEHYLRIQHCLITHPGVQLKDVTKVMSHPQALAQCEKYLHSLKNVKIEATYDTAGSVKLLKESGELTTAAIASRRAAEVYQMHILAENIEDNAENYTRFLGLAKEPVKVVENAKTTIVFSLKNEPGSLFKALSVFALRDIDLSKIESRPIIGKPWEYLFYIDFLGSIEQPKVTRALEHLSEYAMTLRVFGSYPRHSIGNSKK